MAEIDAFIEKFFKRHGIEKKENKRFFKKGYLDGKAGCLESLKDVLEKIEATLQAVTYSKCATGISPTQTIDYLTGWAIATCKNGMHNEDFAAGMYEGFLGNYNTELSASYLKGYRFAALLKKESIQSLHLEFLQSQNRL